MLFKRLLMVVMVTLCFIYVKAWASYFPLSDTGSASNIGIGTFSATGGKLIVQGGNVGISSLTPGTLLDVQGTVRSTGFNLNTNPGAGYVLVSGSTGIGTWMAPTTLPSSGGASGWSTGSGTVYNTTGSDKVGVGTTTPQGGLVVTNGNVGIGTWVADLAALNVMGDTVLGNARTIVSTFGSIPGFLTILPTSTAKPSLNIIHPGGSQSYISLYSSGGTYQGSIDYLARAIFQTYFGTYIAGGDATIDSTTNASKGNVILNPVNGNVGVGTANPRSKLSVSGGVGIGTGFNSAYVTTAAPSGGLIVQGNVGMGTTTPQTGLVVMGNVGLGTWTASNARLETDGFRLINNGSAPGSVLVSSSTGVGTWMPATTLPSAGGSSGWSTGSGTVYNTTGSDNVGIGTSTPQGALVVTNGNVGVGTWTTDVAKLNVVGDTVLGNAPAILASFGSIPGFLTIRPLSNKSPLQLIASSGASADFINFNLSSGSTMGIIDVQGRATFNTYFGSFNASGVLTLDSTSSTTKGNVIINPVNGNVGVGTANPGSRLSVAGGVGIGTWFNSTYVTTAAPSGGLIVQGNVGMGTTTPQTGLVVMGNVGLGTWTASNARLETDGFRLINNGSAPGSVLVSSSTGVGTWMPATTLPSAGGSSGWSTGSGTVYATSVTDNVGIGTSAPQTKLAVQGAVGIGTWVVSSGTTLAVVGGNIGLGTTLPTNTVHILRGSTSTYGLIVDATSTSTFSAIAVAKGGTAYGVLSALASDSNFYISSSNTVGKLVLSGGTGNNPGQYIDSAGNAGLGTATPQTKLVVMGNVGLGTWTASNARLETDGFRLINNGSAPGSVLVSSSTGVGTWMPATTLPISGGSSGWSTGSGTVYATTGTDSVGIGTSTPQGGFVVTNGNVGIGTFVPVAPLDIIGSTVTNSSGIRFFVPGRSTSFRLWQDISSSIRIDNGTTATGVIALNGAGAGNVGIGTFVPNASLNVLGNVGIGTNGAFLNSLAPSGGLMVQGNVGIGTTSFTAGRLSIGTGADTSTQLALYGGASGFNIMTMERTSGSTGKYGWAFTGGGLSFNDIGGGSSLPTLTLIGSNSTNIAYIGSLGTSASHTRPSVISGSTFASAAGTDVPGTDVILRTGAGTGAGTLPNLYLQTADTTTSGTTAQSFSTKVTLTGLGNIGVGTLTPLSRLAVVGNIGIGTGINSTFVRTAPALGGMIVEGNVGIGTTTPQNKLTILGNVGIGTWTASTGALIVQGGNVGIGTAVVPSTLSVKGSISQVPVALTDAATVATDASLGNLFRVTLGGNRTLGNPTNGTDGQRVTWELIQDGTGSRTITLDTKFGLGADIASVTLSTTASKRDFLIAIYNAAMDKWYVVGFVKGY